MPLSVIQQVHFLALQDDMPLLRDRCLIFERRPGVPLDGATLHNEAVIAANDDIDDLEDAPYLQRRPQQDFPFDFDDDISAGELHDLLSSGSLPVGVPPRSREERAGDGLSDRVSTPTSESTEDIPTLEYDSDDDDDDSDYYSVDSVSDTASESESDSDEEVPPPEAGASQDNTAHGSEEGAPDGGVAHDSEGGASNEEVAHGSEGGVPEPPEPSASEQPRYSLRNRDELRTRTKFNKKV